MDSIVVDVELTPADWDALQRYMQGRLQRQTSLRDRLLNALLAGVGSMLLVYVAHFFLEQSSFLVAFGALLVIGCCWVLLARRARTAARPTSGSSMMARTRFELDATGLRAIRAHHNGFVDWLAIDSVDETPEHVFLSLDRFVAYVIPKRQIVSITPDVLVAQVRQWHAARGVQGASSPVDALSAGEASSTEPASRVEALPTTPGFWRSLRTNLLVGMRVFFFRRTQPEDIVSSFDQVAGLLIVLLAVVVVLDRATAGSDAEFNQFGVYTWLALLLSGLWICALIARSMNNRADTRTLLVVSLATAPWVIIVTTALSLIPAAADNPDWYAYAILAVVLWASFRAIRAAYGHIQRQAAIVIAVSLVVFSIASNYLYLDTHLWSEPSTDDEDTPETPSSQEAETILFDQPGFIDDNVNKLAPQRPGVTDLYYVGFAGDGYQRVFRREALLAQDVFAKRMGTGPRSLELINDYEDRESFPLGTLVSLRYALSEIGKVMDPKEDVLVLLLTSHGSREGGISIRNGVTPMDSDLPPDEVRSALDDSGIRWRIVIVSACYSGVFVEPLKTDTTMIVTAADSQHTSFGCADDRDLTYFGEAFLRDSLPKAPSLEAAFERARDEIAEREKQEKLTPSNPQLWVGASMAKKLSQLGPLPLN